MEGSTNDWPGVARVVASGVLACIAAICVTYLVLRIWPRAHYPRFFALLAGVGSVAPMYLAEVPGAGFALAALAMMSYFSLYALDSIENLFKQPAAKKEAVATASAPTVRPHGLGHIIVGAIAGVIVSGAAASAVLVPPTSVREWLTHPDALQERVRRALNPTKEWTELVTRERDARLALARAQGEVAALTKRANDAEASLAKALDEVGTLTPNTARGIAVQAKSGSRHAGSLIYIGVDWIFTAESKCYMIASSDKIDSSSKGLKPGEAIKVATSKGSYRIVLTGVGSTECTFDLIKE